MIKYMLFAWTIVHATFVGAQGLKGQVIDEETMIGIPFAQVFITNVHIGVVCDSLGNFSIKESVPDNIDIRVSAPLYETLLLSIPSNQFLTVKLHEHHVDFDDIVVSGPVGGSSKDNAFRVDKLELSELNSLQSSSLGEAIANINGVQEASFGSGVSKPVIRGMQGVRVLTMINGMRIENQQWGGDHGMAVNQLGIGSVEVIKGPSSLLYGADAFGGVVYLVDEPYNQQNSYEVTAGSKFESVNLGSTSTLGLKLAKGAIRFNLNGLYSDYADYQVPNGLYASNTRYGEHGFKSSIGISKKNWVSHLRYTYSSNHTGLPGHAHEEGEEEEEHDENYHETQERDTEAPVIQGQNHLVSFENKFFMRSNELSVMLGFTHNDLREFEDDLTFPALQMNLTNALYNIRYKWKVNENWSIYSGIQGMYQMNRNRSTAPEQLIPDFNQLDNGLYALASYKKGVWNAQFGARYDIRILSASSANFENTYSSPNFSAGLVRSSAMSTIRANVASGFRAPHLSELLSDGEHEGAIRYEIGNDKLVSEKSVQIDLSYELHREHFEWIVNPFYNYISNYIYLANQDSVINELPVYQYEQVENANLYGIDLGVHYHPHFAHWLHVESSYSYIRGEDLKGNSFSMMPQARINSLARINFNSKGKFRVMEVSLQHQYYFAQNKVDDFELASGDYHLMHIGMDMLWDIKTPIRIGVGVKNLFNERYINHLSRLKNIGLENPGRNLYVSLKFDIRGKLK